MRLALPALGALAAEPLYVLGDTAIVGHVSTKALAGLALGGLLLSEALGFVTVLEYGATAKVSRLFGAGKQDEALDVGVQATWFALALGLLALGVFELARRPRAAPARGRRHAGRAAGARLAADRRARRAVRARDRRRPGLDARVPGHAHAVRRARHLEPRQHRALAAARAGRRARDRGLGDRERRRAGRLRRVRSCRCSCAAARRSRRASRASAGSCAPRATSRCARPRSSRPSRARPPSRPAWATRSSRPTRSASSCGS